MNSDSHSRSVIHFAAKQHRVENGRAWVGGDWEEVKTYSRQRSVEVAEQLCQGQATVGSHN